MRNNVIVLFFFFFFCTNSGDTFRLFSSNDGTYKEARPFFTSPNTLINDYFDGNLAHVSQTINTHTFTFVMYYANFCGISRRMREPYEKAAAFYRERLPQGNTTIDKFHVKFVAIDCFYHNGQCRKSYKLNYYPHMLLYVKGTHGYQYFGPAITSNLIEFIEKIRLPVVRLVNVNEYFDFIVQHEYNILAYFDFSDSLQRKYYSLFTQAALKHIEYDNEHPTRFGVILNQSIVEELSILYNQTFSKPFVILHRLNSSPKIFPNLTDNFTMDHLFQWVINEYEYPKVGWIVPKNRYYSRSPSADKATLFHALTDSDNLLVFLTANKLDELKLRQISVALSDCNITHSSLWLRRIDSLYNQSLISLRDKLTKRQHYLLSSCCQYALNQISTVDMYHLCVLNYQLSSLNLSEEKTRICRPMLENVTLQKICYRNYCQQWLQNYSSIHQQRDNTYHEIILDRRRERLNDEVLNIQKQIRFDETTNDAQEKYKGFLCQMNSTWTFRLINSRSYPNFGQNIGLSNETRAIIVLQSKNEQHYILNSTEITTENIYQLIYNISHNLQTRSYATIPPNEILIDRHSNRLLELTTDTFHSIVFNPAKHVLVVYYTKWCGFCQSIWPVLFQAKNFFRNFPDLLFTRIQADKHDLPWHLTVFSYPTLILFPAERKNHSIVFPISTESINDVNLIKFLLYHLYVDDNNVSDQWCKHSTNNTFFSMLSSTYIDFSQLSYLVKSFS